MKLFGKTPDTPNADQAVPDREALLAQFKQNIHEQRNLLYGIALFFEGLSMLYAGRQEIIDSYREQFRDLLGNGTDMLDRAEDLLEIVKHDGSRIGELMTFDFAFLVDYPEPEELARRAAILVESYETLFPGRPRDQSFSDEERFRLMEMAAKRL
jgi:signal transduction histidine kinase